MRPERGVKAVKSRLGHVDTRLDLTERLISSRERSPGVLERRNLLQELDSNVDDLVK